MTDCNHPKPEDILRLARLVAKSKAGTQYSLLASTVVDQSETVATLRAQLAGAREANTLLAGHARKAKAESAALRSRVEALEKALCDVVETSDDVTPEAGSTEEQVAWNDSVEAARVLLKPDAALAGPDQIIKLIRFPDGSVSLPPQALHKERKQIAAAVGVEVPVGGLAVYVIHAVELAKRAKVLGTLLTQLLTHFPENDHPRGYDVIPAELIGKLRKALN